MSNLWVSYTFFKTVLCLGELKASDTVIYTKESAGIEFVYPEKVVEGTR